MASRHMRLVVVVAASVLLAVPVIALAQEGGEGGEVEPLEAGPPDHAGPPWAEEGDGPPWGPPPWANAGGEGVGAGGEGPPDHAGPPWAEEGDGPPWGPPPWAGPDGDRDQNPGRGQAGPRWYDGEPHEPGSGRPPWAGGPKAAE